MTAPRSEAERIRQCRETFAFAVANGLTMAAARDELVRRRWAEADRRLRDRMCGTSLADQPVDDERQLQWWQR